MWNAIVITCISFPEINISVFVLNHYCVIMGL